MQKINSGSKIKNPVDLQIGSVTESIIDRGMQLYSEEPVTWTGTEVQFTQPIDIQFPLEAGDFGINRIPVLSSPIALSDGQAFVVRLSRVAGPLTLVAGTYATLAAGEYATVNISALTEIILTKKDHIILFRRRDTSSGIQFLLMPLHKQILSPGQTVYLGASGSGSSGSGDSTPIPGYQWREDDGFTALPSSTDSKVTTTSYTNAVFNIAKTLYRASCDKSKTVATNAGTSLTINLAPTFTVAIGDIAYITSGARSGQWRRITAVGSQTSFTLDSAFTGGNASAADTLMVTQAVWSKDLVNLGSATEKTRARDQFSGNILQIAIDYFDSLTVGDDVADLVETARMVVSASNKGLVADTGVPLASEFSTIFTRVAAPGQIDDYVLSTNTNQERLHLVFFPNPANGSVTSGANLLGYEANFYPEDYVLNGGALDSAFCFSDASGTEINCTVATPAGFTEVTTSWSFVPAINPGRTVGQLRVYVDGLQIPRFVAGSTADAYYTEVVDSSGIYRMIRFHTDLSLSPVSIEIHRSEGIVDSSSSNSTRISTLYEIIVGSAAQVTAGTANYSDIQSAINAATAGQRIVVLQGTYSGNISVDRKLFIEGRGHTTVISGTLTFTSTSDFSLVKNLRVTSTITFNSGADGIFMTDCWQATAQTITDNGSGNQIVVIQE